MCEGCETNFQVEDRLIKSTGSKVRCSKCRHVFVAYAPAALAVAEEPLILSDELPATASAGARVELPEIGSQIDALFANDFGVAADTPADQEPELLDVEDLLAEDSPPVSALTTGAPDDDLKLDLDLDLNFDEDATAPSAAAAPPPVVSSSEEHFSDLIPEAEASPEEASGGMLASLDELGVKLESLEGMDDEVMTAASDTGAASGGGTPELDLELDLDALVAETDEAATPEASAAETDASPGEALGALAEAVLADSAEATRPATESELDLSDLEAMLEGDLQAAEPPRAAEELDLDLGADVAASGSETAGDLEELDLTSIAGEEIAADSAGAADEPPAEFDLALDAEDAPSAVPPAVAAVEPQDDELDFSDITNILEEPPAEPGRDVADAAPALDLFLGEEPPEAVPSPPAEVQDGLLLDIESLLQEEDTSTAEAEPKPAAANEELDLDIAAAAAPAMADDLEIEIEPAADGSDSHAPAGPIAVADEWELEPAAATDHSSAEALAATGAGGVTDALDMEPAAAAALAAAAPRQSGLRRYLLIAVGVVVLALAAILVPRSLDVPIPFLSDLEIPFLGKVFQTQPEDVAGNLKMAPIAENLVAEFVEHPGAGRLCVVRGQIRNSYDHPRSAIRVTAKLYTKDKTLAKTATVFAGNLLSNQELAAQDMAAINASLKNKEGANRMNVAVKPGRTVPFMAVFDQLPDNLDEYSVEVAGSTK